jgi:cardiolipin synthase A/B
MKLLTIEEYFKDAAREITHAKSRVYTMTLAIAREERTEAFMKALIKSSERGLDINVAADTFTYSEFGGHFSPFKKRTERSKAATAFTEDLIKAGVEFTWLGGNHKINPFAGVTHIKWTVVDDIVYAFGGVNLYGKGAINQDYMFKISDKKLANILVSEQNKITTADQTPADYGGLSAKLDYGRLMIDSGKRGDSIIYDRAVELAEKAESILYVSQYCPTGELADYVKAKADKVYFNQPTQTSFSTSLLIRSSQLITGLRSSYTKPRYLHAKFIVFTMGDGSKIAMAGSHNFSYGGVRFGTREVVLETADKKIITQLENYFTKSIK